MVFSSSIFLFIFLPITFFLYFAPSLLLQKKLPSWQNSCLIILSLFFYSWGEGFNVLIMLTLILNAWFTALLFVKYKNFKKALFIFSIVLTLSPLVYFKYSNFFIYNLNQFFSLKLTSSKTELPIGISFFTFQLISYLADVYLNQVSAQKSIAKLILYISFFPQLIAGPIVRYINVAQEIDQRSHTLKNFCYGTERFIIGLAQKVIIANSLGAVADRIYQLPLSQNSANLLWLAALCYSFQIYYDFSGYSNMGIGMARMFGFHFLENFNYPYSSTSITEFWRRWHISLSTWFRDYVYIPLGGNRKGHFRTYFNLSLVFLLCGLWHGASWNFIIWGALHGLLLIFEKSFLGKIFLKLPKFILLIYTLVSIVCLWVFFRISELALTLDILKMMFNFTQSTSAPLNRELITPETIVILFFALIFAVDPKKLKLRNKKLKEVEPIGKDLILESRNINLKRALLMTLILILSLGYLANSSFNPFIYYRF